MHTTDESNPLLTDLTPPQREAVLHTEGPLLVLAAAGSGKTRVITRRIAHLIHLGIAPWNIMALTFTNKAAGEMRERVHALLADAGERVMRGLSVTTFHSLCARLLRRYAEAAGLKPDFSIYDSSDQMSLAKKVIADLGINTSNFPPRSVLSVISGAKNELMSPDDYAAQATDFYAKTVAKVYHAYHRALRSANAVDFDDLLLLTARVLKSDASVRNECQARWRYLLIDEYQDTNHAQFMIASMLAGTPAPGVQPNICVVGDPDQAIYGWRGADIANILEFEEHYPGAHTIKLGENFRSTQHILATADTLIRNNKRRKHKPLFTSKSGGDRIELVSCRDEGHEARLVADWLRARHEDGVPWRQMAIFYRTNALSRVVEDACRSSAMPYTIARGTAFYEREEVKTAIAYLRVIANTADGVSLERIVNTPARGIGDTTFSKVDIAAASAGVPVFVMMQSPRRIEGLSARAIGAIEKFTAMVDGWTGNGTFLGADVSGSLAELVSRVLKESGIESMYAQQAKTSGSEADMERLDNLAELVNSAREFELEFDVASDPSGVGLEDGEGMPPGDVPPLLAMLRAYLESIALVADADAVDPAQGAVTLMTLHAAKGLEFDSVAIIGLEEGVLPHSRARESEDQLEEERRLCFVGITRSMRRLLMTHASVRAVRGQPERTFPSRFLDELPREHITLSDQARVMETVGERDWGDAEFDQTGEGPRRGAGERAPFPVGAVVRHPQFGEGQVVSVTSGASARATIRFNAVGTKTIVLEYGRLTRVR
jgi:DNA helicase-2/ATP-dependent DNA helicase PcrA